MAIEDEDGRYMYANILTDCTLALLGNAFLVEAPHGKCLISTRYRTLIIVPDHSNADACSDL